MDTIFACAVKNRFSLRAVLSLSVLLIVSTASTTQVYAATQDGTYNMIVNGRSYHLSNAPKGKTYNENNFGTGVQYDFGRGFGSKWVSYITTSAFYDSYNNLSYYVGGGEARRFYMSNGWYLDVGYVGFMMARKDINDYKPFPGALPIASVGTRNVALNMTYIPKIGNGRAELLFFQLKISTEAW